MTSEEILGFDPKQSEYKCFMATITPEKAEYILKHHNKDNRPFYQVQLKAIDKSIDDDGWCNDGGAMSINTNGDLTEYQHRLDRIKERELTEQVPVVVGVKPDAFTKTAPAKKRTPVDEMYRKDSSARKDDEVGLRQVLKHEGRTKLTMKNAIEEWERWKYHVRKGIKIAKDIVDKTEDYKSWAKEIVGFASLMVYIGEESTAKNLLSLLKKQVHGEETTLTKEFVKYRDFDSGSPLNMSNAEKTNIKFLMLCHAADRLKEQSDGMIQLALTPDKCTQEKMRKKGVYNKFLFDANNVGTAVKYAGKVFTS